MIFSACTDRWRSVHHHKVRARVYRKMRPTSSAKAKDDESKSQKRCKMKALICVVIFILFMGVRPVPASAAEIRYQYSPRQNFFLITIAGEIKEGDDTKFKQLLEFRKVLGAVVFLSSPGGAVGTGINIGREIKARKFVTVVDKDQVCASMCGAIWLAGRIRFVHEVLASAFIARI
jgi:ClpP class serine protease